MNWRLLPFLTRESRSKIAGFILVELPVPAIEDYWRRPEWEFGGPVCFCSALCWCHATCGLCG